MAEGVFNLLLLSQAITFHKGLPDLPDKHGQPSSPVSPCVCMAQPDLAGPVLSLCLSQYLVSLSVCLISSLVLSLCLYTLFIIAQTDDRRYSSIIPTSIM